jgi:hypothetical protein
MSAPSFGLDALTPLRSSALPDRVSNNFADGAASRAGTGMIRGSNDQTLDLRDEVLSTSMFEEIVRYFRRNQQRNRAGDESCS